MTTVYIAGPLGKSMKLKNTQKAMKVANEVMRAGMHFYLPHFMTYMDRYFKHHYEEWMAEDFFWLEKCDCLLRMPGESPGADREVEYALGHGIPVFHSLEDVIKWRDSQLSSLF